MELECSSSFLTYSASISFIYSDWSSYIFTQSIFLFLSCQFFQTIFFLFSTSLHSHRSLLHFVSFSSVKHPVNSLIFCHFYSTLLLITIALVPTTIRCVWYCSSSSSSSKQMLWLNWWSGMLWRAYYGWQSGRTQNMLMLAKISKWMNEFWMRCVGTVTQL